MKMRVRFERAHLGAGSLGSATSAAGPRASLETHASLETLMQIIFSDFTGGADGHIKNWHLKLARNA